MKTLIALAAIAWSSFGQGTVDFNNKSSVLGTNNDYLVRFPDGSPVVGTNYVAQLYYGPVGAEADSFTAVACPPARFRIPTTSLPGTWRLDQPPPSIPTPYGIDGITDILLQVRVWDSNLAMDWGAVLDPTYAGLYGASAVFSFRFFQQSPPHPSDDNMVNFRGFMLVPEPTALALVNLGALGLLIFRRR